MNKSTHPSRYFASKILLATPQMKDPRFKEAVILICGHDKNGAMGLVINNIMVDIGFAHVLKELDIKLEGVDDATLPAIPIMDGGPVEKGKGFLLHSKEFKKPETIAISDSYAMTGTVEALQDIADGKGPKDLIFILGYAGWEEGQLEEELKQNSWLVIDTSNDFIFNVPAREKWETAIKSLGFDPAHLSNVVGRA